MMLNPGTHCRASDRESNPNENEVTYPVRTSIIDNVQI